MATLSLSNWTESVIVLFWNRGWFCGLLPLWPTFYDDIVCVCVKMQFFLQPSIVPAYRSRPVDNYTSRYYSPAGWVSNLTEKTSWQGNLCFRGRVSKSQLSWTCPSFQKIQNLGGQLWFCAFSGMFYPFWWSQRGSSFRAGLQEDTVGLR